MTIVDEHGVEQTIETTDGHPFWVVTDSPDLDRAAQNVINENGATLYHENLDGNANGYWVHAKDLQISDVFLGANGELSTLTGVLRLEVEGGIGIFNFTVEGNHNYFILAKDYEYGLTCVLVHNNSALPEIVQTGGNKLTNYAAREIIKYNELNPRVYNRGKLGDMLEALKLSEELPNNHHGKIGIDGSYYSPEGVYIGNFLE